MIYKIAICDDEADFARRLSAHVSRYAAAHTFEITSELFCCAEDFLQSHLEQYDLVFLDVRLGTSSGIDLAKALRERNQRAALVFVSAFVEYAILGYSVRASAYLLKSDLEGTLENCLDEIFALLCIRCPSIQIPYENTTVEISCRHLLYLESYKRQIQIHTTLPALPSAMYYARLSDMVQALQPHGFLQIHKSYLVNLRHCLKIKNKIAYLDDGTQLPCSRQNYRDILQKFLQWKEREPPWN